VADSFLEAWELFLAHVKLPDKHIQISALVAHIHSEPRRVINHYDCQSQGDRKGARSEAGIIADGSDQRHNESGMSRRHVAVRHGIVPIPTVFQGKNYEFCKLDDEADGHRYQKYVIGLEKRHLILFYL